MAHLVGVCAGFLLACCFVSSAVALVVELEDVAPDRIERQRAFSRGTLTPTEVPAPTALSAHLAAKGLSEGAPILIRIFKAESELELWIQKDERFVLKALYPICHWTGTLGPKLREGDKQSPEGFYSVGRRQMRHLGRWRQAFNLGFPNLHDKRLGRTGSYILVHGGCSSTGCYAMTQPVQQVIYRLASASLRGRQESFQVHIFPFRMTDANMAAHADSPWIDFWRDLKAGYDAFEVSRVPPRIGLCGRRYVVAPGVPGGVYDARLARIDPRKPEAAAFDTSRCELPGAAIIAKVPGAPKDDAGRASGTASAGAPSTRAVPEISQPASPGRTVARVARQEPAAAVIRPAPVERPVTSRRARARLPVGPRSRKASPRPATRAQAEARARRRADRQAYRAALRDLYRRTLINPSH